jgi:ubiquinone/menaquinone biosynthesis C-methylase UbiE
VVFERRERTADHKQEVVQHFDKLSLSHEWSSFYDGADPRTYHMMLRQARVKELLPPRLGRVLDVGCGPGIMATSVVERGGTFDGIDLSEEMIREAQARFGDLDGVQFRTGDIEHLDVPDGAYDQVICMGVVEYLPQADQALAEISRVLAPGGIALVTVPKRWHIGWLAWTATAPVRRLVRLTGRSGADALPRLRMQPTQLDQAAARHDLVADGGSQYYFTPLPYPFTRLVPQVAMQVNRPFERFHRTRSPIGSFFAHGFIGRYRKRP